MIKTISILLLCQIICVLSLPMSLPISKDKCSRNNTRCWSAPEDCVDNDSCFWKLSIEDRETEFVINIDEYHQGQTNMVTGVKLETFNDLGNTSIIECREPTLDDFKVLLFLNTNNYTNYYRSITRWTFDKSNYIYACNSYEFKEISNPINQTKFAENSIPQFYRLKGVNGFLRDWKNVEFPEIKTEDGQFYTNYQNESQIVENEEHLNLYERIYENIINFPTTMFKV